MPRKPSRISIETLTVLDKVADVGQPARTDALSDAGVARGPLEAARRAHLLTGPPWSLTPLGDQALGRHRAQLAALRARGPTVSADDLVHLCRSFVTFTKAAGILGADRVDRLTAEAALYVDPATRELVVAGQDGSEVRLPPMYDMCPNSYARAVLVDFLRGPG